MRIAAFVAGKIRGACSSPLKSSAGSPARAGRIAYGESETTAFSELRSEKVGIGPYSQKRALVLRRAFCRRHQPQEKVQPPTICVWLDLEQLTRFDALIEDLGHGPRFCVPGGPGR